MNLYCPQGERKTLGFGQPRHPKGIVVSTQAVAYQDHFNVAWIPQVENPTLEWLQRVLSMDQVWVPEKLISKIETMGVPRFRMRVCSGIEEMESLAEEFEKHQEVFQSGREAVWRGPFGDNGSLATVNSMTCQALEKRGWKIHLTGGTKRLFGVDAPGVSQSWPPVFTPSSDGPFALLAPWEYSYIPREWAREVPKYANRLWMPSEYAKAGAVASGCNSQWVQVAYPGVDLDIFQPISRPASNAEQGDRAETTFLFVGGLIGRKGIDILQRAWELAFKPGDPVRLVIKGFGSTSHYRNGGVAGTLAIWSTQDTHAPVTMIDKDIPSEEMPDLYHSADVIVLPYRAEGFCMPALEGMACGKPVILPNHGPTEEFCQEGGWKVAARRTEQSFKEMNLSGPAVQHEISSADLAETMREVASNPEEIRRRGQAARNESERWSWDKTALQIEQHLLELQNIKKPVHQSTIQRPQGSPIILAMLPQWEQEGWSKEIIELDTKMRGNALASRISIAIWIGEKDPAQYLEKVMADLRRQGCNPEEISLDITMVSGADQNGFILGCDALIQSHDQDSSSDLGRPCLLGSQVLAWAERFIAEKQT